MADKANKPAEAPATFKQVLGNRPFLLLWVGQFVSSFGDWLAILALFSLIAFRWKGTPDQVAGMLIAFILPWVVLGPLSGVFVDRWNLKRAMIASDLLRAGLVLLLAFAGSAWQVYLLMAAVSTVSCFFMPAMNAAIPRLVKKEELLVANSLNAQTVHFNKIVAPAIAGLLVAWAGEKACFYIDAVSFLFSAGMIAAVKIGSAAGEQPLAPTEGRAAEKGLSAVFAEFREGFLFLHGHRALRFVVLAMSAAMFIIGAFDALIAVYVRETLHADSKIFGALVSVIGIGTIAGSVWVGKYAQQKPKILLIVWGIFGIGVGVLLLALATTAVAAVACSLTLGLAVSAVLVPSQTLMQEETPQAMLGRVSSTSLSLMTVAQLIGVSIAGKLAAWMGIRNFYYLLAALLVLIGVSGYLYAKRNRLQLHGAAPVNE